MICRLRCPCGVLLLSNAFVSVIVMASSVCAGEIARFGTQEIPLVVERFPDRGTTEGLDPEVLDFRYRPTRWQTCIGLVDDLYKTVVGSDGGLYYEYGKRGPEPYNNGQGTFGTRVLLKFLADEPASPNSQTLYSARVPIVITDQTIGPWRVRQEAWSGVGRDSDGRDRKRQDRGQAANAHVALNELIARRVDYLAVTVTNTGQMPASGKLLLDVGSTQHLEVDDARSRLLIDGDANRVFAQFSMPCQPLEAARKKEPSAIKRRIRSNSVITVQRDWARPRVDSAPCFRHVMVGFGQPLDFRLPTDRGGKLVVMLGLIEGWHAEPGKRPLRIEVEGAPVQLLDLVKQYGQNVPVVLSFAGEDADGDGVLRVRILPVASAEDRNTILSGLWAFAADTAPKRDEILKGTTKKRPVFHVDTDHVPGAAKPIQLAWATGTVAPGASFSVLIALPQGARVRRGVTLRDPAIERQRCIDRWQSADLPYDRMIIPDSAVQALLDSCIRNIYQAREWKDGRPKFQVGPTCYRGTWAADGPFLLEAVSYLGRTDEARAGLEQQVDGDDGPSGVEFSKKSGLRLWMMWRHAQLTGDRKWLKKMWPRVVREVEQIVKYRQMTRDDPTQTNYGLMPIGFGDGGLGGKHREYTNVYWTLAGLKAAIEMAELLKEPAASDWKAEYKHYWAAFEKARNRDKRVDTAGNTYVPVTMKGEQEQLPQRGAWAFLQSIFPGRIFAPDDPLMLGTLAMLDANQREGLIYGTGWIPDGIWNYAASFYAHAHLWQRHGRKAAATLYAFGNHASPLLCWREEQNPVGERPHFVGDMPHNWGSAEFIRLVRHLVILERGDELHLFEGLPRAWTRPGAVLRMRAIPTSFGPIDLAMEVARDGRSARIAVVPPKRARVDGLIVHLESFARPVAKVKVGETVIDPNAASIPSDRTSTINVVFDD